MKIEIDDIDDDKCVYGATQKVITMIANTLNEKTIKAIYRYCDENNIYPNIIDEDKLKYILQLGIQEYELRQMRGEDNE